MASAWRNCLNITRLWQCSPVATRIGCTAARMRAWPRTSSGLVGSSIQYGSTSARALTLAMASLDVPHLVGVEHEAAVGPDLAADERGPAEVVGEVAADLHLQRVPAVGDGLPALGADLVVVVAEPPGRGDVRRVARRREAAPPARPCVGASRGEEAEGVGLGERVGDVAEVDRRHDLLGREVDEVLPQRQSRPDGPAGPTGRSRAPRWRGGRRPSPGRATASGCRR